MKPGTIIAIVVLSTFVLSRLVAIGFFVIWRLRANKKQRIYASYPALNRLIQKFSIQYADYYSYYDAVIKPVENKLLFAEGEEVGYLEEELKIHNDYNKSHNNYKETKAEIQQLIHYLPPEDRDFLLKYYWG